MSTSDGRGWLDLLLGRSSSEADRRAASLVHALADGVWVVDRRGSTVFMSRRMASLCGKEPAACEGIAASEIVAPDACPAEAWWRRPLPSAFGGKVLGTAEETRVRVAPAAHDLDGRSVLACVVSVVEAQKARPANACDALASLGAELATRDALLRIAAHQLRSPLAGARMEVVALQHYLSGVGLGESMQEEVAARLDAVGLRMEALGRLVQNLLDTSRIHGGRMKLSAASFDLAVLARDVAARFESAAARRGGSVIVRGPSQLMVRLDRIQVEQMMDNLVANALHFGGMAPVLIELELGRGWVTFAVSDRGPGIPADQQEVIFGGVDRVIRGASPQQGLGVGLWIVRTMALMHGGDVGVRSSPGDTKFTVRLPLSP